MEPLLTELRPSRRSRLPLLLLISGAPGSGKTTLASELARHLRLFHLHRDGIWDGLRFTAARGSDDRLPHGVEVWYATASLLLRSGVSLVADGTLYRGWDEGKVRPLLDLGEVVNVHCQARGALDRFAARLRCQGGSEDVVSAMVARAAGEQDRTREPLELGCRRYLVDTTAGYVPSLDDLVEGLRV